MDQVLGKCPEDDKMKALLLDTETSGLISNRSIKLAEQPHIIEWYSALVDFLNGTIEQELDFLIKPPQPVSDEIIKITGITNEMLKGAYDFGHYKNAIKETIENASLVIAHNLSFDMEIVALEAERHSLEIKWPQKCCTVEATIHLLGYRLTLSGLHEHLFGRPFTGAHRAKQDAQALIRCAVELYKRGEI